MTLTEENNLTREQLLEMLHDAWNMNDGLEDQLEQGSYEDGFDDGYYKAKEEYLNDDRNY